MRERRRIRAAASGPDTITVDVGESTSNIWGGVAMEYSGVTTLDSHLASAIGPAPATQVASHSVGPVATVNDKEVLVAYTLCPLPDTNIGGGFALRHRSLEKYFVVGDLIAPTAGMYSAQFVCPCNAPAQVCNTPQWGATSGIVSFR